jgi:hypothetical protein
MGHPPISQIAQLEGIGPKEGHEVVTAQQAVHLVSERIGVGIIFKPTGPNFHEENVVIKPLSDPILSFETCLVMRAEDNSRATNEFGRAFLKRFVPHVLRATQIELPLSA